MLRTCSLFRFLRVVSISEFMLSNFFLKLLISCDLRARRMLASFRARLVLLLSFEFDSFSSLLLSFVPLVVVSVV